MLVAPHPQGRSAANEGEDLYRQGLTIEEAFARSYYVKNGQLHADFHVAQGYAQAAEAAGADKQTVAGYRCYSWDRKR